MNGSRLGAVIAALAVLSAPMSVQVSSPIARDQLADMFANMRATAPWNVDGPLLWGYFFTSSDPTAAKRAGDVLVGQGYRFVEVYQNDGVWWLHVERVEKHTVDSLDTRNAELSDFAQGHGLIRYDGMDVGAAPQP